MEHRNVTFQNERVVLDGNAYIGCTFLDCEIVFTGGTETSFVGNRVVDCRWIFEGAAACALNFMADLYRMGGGGRQLIEDTIKNTFQGEHVRRR